MTESLFWDAYPVCLLGAFIAAPRSVSQVLSRRSPINLFTYEV